MTASRHSYTLQLREVKSEEWNCCPGFYGNNCENGKKMLETNFLFLQTSIEDCLSSERPKDKV